MFDYSQARSKRRTVYDFLGTRESPLNYGALCGILDTLGLGVYPHPSKETKYLTLANVQDADEQHKVRRVQRRIAKQEAKEKNRIPLALAEMVKARRAGRDERGQYWKHPEIWLGSPPELREWRAPTRVGCYAVQRVLLGLVTDTEADAIIAGMVIGDDDLDNPPSLDEGRWYHWFEFDMPKTKGGWHVLPADARTFESVVFGPILPHSDRSVGHARSKHIKDAKERRIKELEITWPASVKRLFDDVTAIEPDFQDRLSPARNSFEPAPLKLQPRPHPSPPISVSWNPDRSIWDEQGPSWMEDINAVYVAAMGRIWRKECERVNKRTNAKEK